jgi:hypothetical protein
VSVQVKVEDVMVWVAV